MHSPTGTQELSCNRTNRSNTKYSEFESCSHAGIICYIKRLKKHANSNRCAAYILVDTKLLPLSRKPSELVIPVDASHTMRQKTGTHVINSVAFTAIYCQATRG